jgi:hypothetical protein
MRSILSGASVKPVSPIRNHNKTLIEWFIHCSTTHSNLGQTWGCAAGLPENLAEAYAHFDIDAARGELFHAGSELSDLIGRPTTPLAEVLPAWLPKSSAAAS